MATLYGLATRANQCYADMEVHHIEYMREIPGYEGRYKATRDGRIWSEPRQVWCKQFLLKNGYLTVNFKIGSVHKTEYVHRLVALTYIPGRDQTVNHLDGCKTNNKVENLEWATYSKNNSHAYAIGLKDKMSGAHMGTSNGNSKLTEVDIPLILSLLRQGFTQRDIAFCWGVSQKTISNIGNGKVWAHAVGYGSSIRSTDR